MYYKLKLPIIRKNYNKTKSARFKGQLEVVSNEYGIIYDWKITFTSIDIDLYTTERWFNDEPTIFKYRTELFNLLDLKQEVRPSKSENKIVSLIEEEIRKVNDYFNNNYKSTLKNIVGILKGNNPGGEAKKPKSAEMIINLEGVNNFVILFDDLMTGTRLGFEERSINAKKIDLIGFVNLTNELLDAFNFMQKPKENINFKIYLDSIKKYVKKYKGDYRQAEIIAEQARGRYNTKVEKAIRNNEIHLPFGFKSSAEFQKAHILDFWVLKDKLVNAYFKGEDYKEIEKQIEDPNNFIPLPEKIHRAFDKDQLTYNLSGNIIAIDEQGYNFITMSVEEQFKKIPEWYLTPERKEYLSERNERINYG